MAAGRLQVRALGARRHRSPRRYANATCDLVENDQVLKSLQPDDKIIQGTATSLPRYRNKFDAIVLPSHRRSPGVRIQIAAAWYGLRAFRWSEGVYDLQKPPRNIPYFGPFEYLDHRPLNPQMSSHSHRRLRRTVTGFHFF